MKNIDIKINKLIDHTLLKAFATAEDIKKLERRVKSQEKKIAAQSGKLPAPTEERDENDDE
ncbi:MAG: hypothetical protein BHW12_06790 [Coprobacillus sp. 28_7]|nr:MAG: hypothetical protein BHW12_06790 [Coprobacillus sp. 28_7]